MRKCASTGWGDSEDESSSESRSDSEEEEESSQFDDELYWSDVVGFFVIFFYIIGMYVCMYVYIVLYILYVYMQVPWKLVLDTCVPYAAFPCPICGLKRASFILRVPYVTFPCPICGLTYIHIGAMEASAWRRHCYRD